MARTWRSTLVEEMLARADARGFPAGWAGAGIRPCPAQGYRLSDAQAQAILELRLQRLTGLEQDKILLPNTAK
jgi:DNA gyrase subunit A